VNKVGRRFRVEKDRPQEKDVHVKKGGASVGTGGGKKGRLNSLSEGGATKILQGGLARGQVTPNSLGSTISTASIWAGLADVNIIWDKRATHKGLSPRLQRGGENQPRQGGVTRTRMMGNDRREM